jgi:peptidoglycan/xylan/chitin deacetylase (PgdA/CDA1 family)
MVGVTGAERSRRAVLLAAAGGLLAACTRSRTTASPTSSPTSAAPRPSSPAAAARTAAASSAPRSAPPAAPRVLRHADTGRAEVALTFHGSGDPALAERLLREVEDAGAVVTVFAVGTWLRDNPAMAKRVLRGGHALGNHTYTHPTLHRLSDAAIRTEVSRCAQVLQRLTGSAGVAFRPSGGSSITPPMVAAAQQSGYSLVLGFDVDPADYTDPGADAVASRTLAAVRPGSIVSLHLGHAGTVTALPRILAGLRSRGLTPVTAPRLVAP